MLRKTEEISEEGERIYENELTGEKAPLKRVTGKSTGRIPDGVYGRFIQPDYMQKVLIPYLRK